MPSMTLAAAATTEPRLLLGPRAVLAAELPRLEPGARALLRALLLPIGRSIEVEGAERLRAVPDPAIFAFNHLSSYEALAAPLAMIFLRGANVHFVVDWMFLHYPLVGAVIRRCGPIPVYTKPLRFRLAEGHRLARRSRSVVDACRERLAAGASVGLYPEGTRNRRPGPLLRGRSGLGWLVLGSTAPVVPVGLRFPAAERLGRTPRLGRLELRVGAPLPFAVEREAHAARSAGSVESRSDPDPNTGRRLARRIVSRVMAELAALSDRTPGVRSPRTSVPSPTPGWRTTR